jgi:hypothetical protein
VTELFDDGCTVSRSPWPYVVSAHEPLTDPEIRDALDRLALVEVLDLGDGYAVRLSRADGFAGMAAGP